MLRQRTTDELGENDLSLGTRVLEGQKRCTTIGTHEGYAGGISITQFGPEDQNLRTTKASNSGNWRDLVRYIGFWRHNQCRGLPNLIIHFYDEPYTRQMVFFDTLQENEEVPYVYDFNFFTYAELPFGGQFFDPAALPQGSVAIRQTAKSRERGKVTQADFVVLLNAITVIETEPKSRREGGGSTREGTGEISGRRNVVFRGGFMDELPTQPGDHVKLKKLGITQTPFRQAPVNVDYTITDAFRQRQEDIIKKKIEMHNRNPQIPTPVTTEFEPYPSAEVTLRPSVAAASAVPIPTPDSFVIRPNDVGVQFPGIGLGGSDHTQDIRAAQANTYSRLRQSTELQREREYRNSLAEYEYAQRALLFQRLQAEALARGTGDAQRRRFGYVLRPPGRILTTDSLPGSGVQQMRDTALLNADSMRAQARADNIEQIRWTLQSGRNGVYHPNYYDLEPEMGPKQEVSTSSDDSVIEIEEAGMKREWAILKKEEPQTIETDEVQEIYKSEEVQEIQKAEEQEIQKKEEFQTEEEFEEVEKKEEPQSEEDLEKIEYAYSDDSDVPGSYRELAVGIKVEDPVPKDEEF
ncbi:hypothetical protein AA313_de0200315 [Arthrobotrys entomopaga]|nr:hypothetical protein AA313_de0200315 [Arthrobotrys entomopaga]